jgi:hypothetical protein
VSPYDPAVMTDFPGSLGIGLIVAGIVVRLLGRPRGGDVMEMAVRVSLVATLVGVALLAVSIYLARPG